MALANEKTMILVSIRCKISLL